MVTITITNILEPAEMIRAMLKAITMNMI